MTDTEFTVGDKELVEAKNQKLSTIEKLLQEHQSSLDPEDLTLLTQAMHEGVQDSLIDEELLSEQDTE